MPIELNSLETDRFGVVAARVVDPEASPRAIEEAAQAADVALLTVRVPVSDLPRVHALEAAGYRLMDTLLYYGRALEGPLPSVTAPPGIRCRLASPDDAEAVAHVAKLGFTGYLGHYHADPRLDRAAADAAYVEWAQTSVATTCAQAPVLVTEAGKLIIGFLTLRENTLQEIEIVLNAVHPAFHKRGIYNSLLAEVLVLAKSRGYEKILTSTQINNYTSQRAWSRLGFCHIKSVYTFHKWFR